MPQTKYICFTLNNYAEDEVKAIESIPVGAPNLVSYITFGREVGANGTRHLQGYLELSRRQRFTAIHRLPGLSRAHLEARKGTAAQASEYCWKEDREPYRAGTISVSQQGRRSDLEATKLALDNGGTIQDVAQEHFGTFLKYHRALGLYASYRAEKRNWQVEVTVYWGETGTGKTRRAHEESKGDAWIYSSDGWFDGYNQEDCVIFDDYSGSEFKIGYLLKLLDRYPMRVRVKGGFVNWKPRRIWITSNLDPESWYPNAHEEHRAALRRRLTQVIHFANLRDE